MNETEPKITNSPEVATQTEEKTQPPKKKHTVLIVVLVLVFVFVVLVAVGGFFGYRYYINKKNIQKASEQTIQNQVIKSTEPVEAAPVFTQ